MRRSLSAIFSAWLLLAGLCAPPAASQDLGNVGLRTVAALLANGLTCTGTAQNFTTGITPGFNNLGQSQHQVSATSTAASFVLEIDGIDAIGTAIRISNPTVSFTTGTPLAYVTQGTGYYPQIRVSVTCTAAATFSMSYSGSFGGSTPIVAQPGTNPTLSPGIAANVQGLIPATQNGAPIFPVIAGAVLPATNAGFTTAGVDNFSVAATTVSSGITGSYTVGFPPTPTTTTETALVFYGPVISIGQAGINSPPWTCLPTQSCNTSSNEPLGAFLNNYASTTPFQVSVTNGGGTTTEAIFVALAKVPTIRQSQVANNPTPVFASNTLAGSTLLIAYYCNQTTACSIATVTDTQGNTWRQLASIFNAGPGGVGTGGTILVWVSQTLSSAAGDTVTAGGVVGTINGTNLLELTALTPANPNTPSVAETFSNSKLRIGENDLGGLMTEAAGFSFSQTATLSAAGTTTQSLWDVTQHGLFSSCVVTLRVTAASGTTPTLNAFLQDSADAVGWNDRLALTQATAATNLLGAVPVFNSSALTATASSAVVSTDGALAAGSGIAGPMGPFGRIKFVVGGTTPSFTITYNVACR
jgi:hypothetical protein